MKVFTKRLSGKGPISRIYEEFFQVINTMTCRPIKNGQWLEETLRQTSTNGQEAQELVFNVVNH